MEETAQLIEVPGALRARAALRERPGQPLGYLGGARVAYLVQYRRGLRPGLARHTIVTEQERGLTKQLKRMCLTAPVAEFTGNGRGAE